MVSARNALSFAFVALACAIVAACGEAPAADDGGDDKPAEIAPPPYESFDERPCPSDSVLTWENFGQPFFNSWCTACHSSQLDVAHREAAPPGVNFDDLDGVREHAERIWIRAADQNDTMPPAGIPPEAERAQLGEWLACGAKKRTD